MLPYIIHGILLFAALLSEKNGFALGSCEECRDLQGDHSPHGKVTKDGFVDIKIPFHIVTVMLHQSSRVCVTTVWTLKRHAIPTSMMNIKWSQSRLATLLPRLYL